MTDGGGPLAALERWQAVAFLLAGLLFVLDVAVLAARLAAGETDPATALGQGFVGAGWTCTFIGLLGVYPTLADRQRWLPRIGAVFAGIGAITMAAMAVVSFGYAADALAGSIADVAMYFLPGVVLGIVPGVGLFAIGALRTGVYRRHVGVLLLALVGTFLVNLGSSIAGVSGLPTVLAVVCALALINLALGYLFRTGRAVATTEDVAAPGDASAG